MKLSLVIPFIDEVDITKKCIETALENAGEDFELVLIDNGSDFKNREEILNICPEGTLVLTNKVNTGVLPSFKQGFESATGDVIGFIHNDVLLHELGWVKRIVDVFTTTPKLGLAGIFGAVGVGENGGRIRPQSKMLGKEWGKCECHEIAWQHHSEYLEGISPAAILDGVGMFFSREAASHLLGTDIFSEWRAPHHFYDRTIPLKLIDAGFRVATVGIGFDHWSGATANSSQKYVESGAAWLQKSGNYIEGKNVDQQIYEIAEQQFFNEFGHRIPCYVHEDWNYEWRGVA